MKKYCLVLMLALILNQALSQSDSYRTMKDTFKGGENVYSVSVSGFLCRAVLAIADEHEFRDAISDVRNVRFITVPKSEFASRNLSLAGFRKVLKEDAFQELANFRDKGDHVSFFLQENDKNKNRYFILVDEGDDIVVIEMKGHVDMDKLMKMKRELALDN